MFAPEKEKKEQLQVLEKLKHYFLDYFGNEINGICLVANYLYYEVDLMNCSDFILLKDYLFANLPKRKTFAAKGNYCWEPGKAMPRIIWLNEQINKLKSELYDNEK